MLRDFTKLWAGRVAQLAVGVGTVACLLRLLPERDYSVFALAVAVSGLVAGLAQLGLSSGSSKLINDALATAPRRIVLLFRRTMAIQVGAYVAFATLTAAIVGRIYPDALAGRPLLVVGIIATVFATVMSEHYLRTARTLEDFSAIAAHQFSMALARFVGAVGIYYLTASLDFAVAGYAVAQIIIAGLFVSRLYRLLVARACEPTTIENQTAQPVRNREVLGVAVPFFVIASGNVIFAQIGQLVLGVHALTTLAGFDAAARLTNALRSPAVAFSFAISSRYGRAVAAADAVAARRTLDVTLRTAGLGVPIAVGLYFSAPWALWLLGGSRYVEAESLVVALVPYFVGAFACDAVSLSLDYSGMATRRAVVTSVTSVLQVALTLLLVPAYQALGVAIALSTSTLVQAALYFTLFRSNLGKSTARPLMRYGAPAAAVCTLPFINLDALGLDHVVVRLAGCLAAGAWLGFQVLRLKRTR